MSVRYLSSGELATLVGRSRDTIRRYEELGLIPRARRDPINGYRYWSEQEAEAIRCQLQPVAAKPDLPAACPAVPSGRRGERDVE